MTLPLGINQTLKWLSTLPILTQASFWCLAECCFTSTETVGLLGTRAQDGHLDFHTPPELCPGGDGSGGDGVVLGVVSHSEHRFPTPSSKLCQI